MKRLPDGRVMLNVGCGSRMHPAWNNIDFSPLAKLRRHPRFSRILWRAGLLSEDRWQRLQFMDVDIIVHDLRRGIPFDDASVDLVYHSHVLEHIDRDQATPFLRECHRVLKTGGTLRVVVPDLELIARQYLNAMRDDLDSARTAEAEAQHRQAVHELFDQMVRREPAALCAQRPIVRFAERTLRGTAEKAGELHRWMYDRFSLAQLLRSVGFRTVIQQTPAASLIEDWSLFHIDTDADGSVYKPGSLYMEAEK